MQIIVKKLISFTEVYLTRSKRSKYIKREKQKRIHPILDWVGAFIWAAGVVLILNQYLFQAYVIPSPSMEKTLLIGDRLFVNKFLFGPELLPGIGKLPGFREPKRTDIIIFENPEYISRGPLFDITQRLLYMLTFTMVDIDKDADGKPAHHFLIKRSIASDGDIIKFINGELYIKPLGESGFFHEKDFMKLSDLNYYTQRLNRIEDYESDEMYRRYVSYQNINYLEESNDFTSSDLDSYDKYNKELTANKFLSQVSPSNTTYYHNYNKREIGIYVPKGWVLPLGDNRDNSKDGRYFGPVREREVLGQASFRFWPFSRIGLIR